MGGFTPRTKKLELGYWVFLIIGIYMCAYHLVPWWTFLLIILSSLKVSLTLRK